ncbi:MAG: DUF1631 domain-containing protein [Pseudomonadota bacterium]|nr:DUF1631 domain-containing protein [Pseudomonadota bacterium]
MDRNVLLATTRAEFSRAFLSVLDATLKQAAATLLLGADMSRSAYEQRRLMGAYQVLRERRDVLQQQLVRGMEQLLNRSFQTTYSTFRPSFLAGYSQSELSLVDANAYEDQLHINEVTARFRHAAEEPLRDLNIRVAILFEQDTINERENPFRPFLFARAIASAVDQLGDLGELNGALFDHVTQALEGSVATIYGNVNAHLAEHGVGAQLQLKIKKSEEVASHDTAADVEMPGIRHGAQRNGDLRPENYPDEQRAGTQRDDETDRTEPRATAPRGRIEQLVNRVRRSAAGAADRFEGRPQSDQDDVQDDNHDGQDDQYDGQHAIPGTPLSASASARRTSLGAGWGSAGMLGMLQKMLMGPSPLAARATVRGTPRVLSAGLDRSLAALMQHDGDASAQPSGTRNILLEQRANLQDATGDIDEQMTIDVVAMLFEFILRDPQIPAEVRAQLGRLQFLVLKIALRESALLTQKNHPARLLVNRIGSVSIGLKQLDPSGERVSNEIRRIVEALLSDGAQSSLQFDLMLDEFDSFIALELRAGDVNVDRTVQAVENAQSRTLRFAHLTAQLAEALAGLTIDPFLHEFLSVSWVRVIERAERAEGMTPVSTRYRQLVPDLLWSILPKFAAQDRRALLALLPTIVGTLRQGLALENWDEARQQALFSWLADAHSSALRSVDTGTPALALAALHRHFDNFVTHPEQDATPAIATSEQDDSSHQTFLAEALQESAAKVQLLDALIEHAEQLTPQSDTALPPAIPHSIALSEADVLERLRSGVAIEITLGSKPGIGRLNWINQHGSTLVLTMEDASETSMLSVRMFLRLLALGRVRFIESAPLFERAVQGLLSSAQQVETERVAARA